MKFSSFKHSRLISLFRKELPQARPTVISIRTCAHMKIAARAPLRVARAHTQGRHLTGRGLRAVGGMGEAKGLGGGIMHGRTS